jgi:hypothetical protein
VRRQSILMMLLLLVAACAERPDLRKTKITTMRSRNSGLGSLVEVQRIQVLEGVTFWENGTQVATQEALLIRVTVDPGRFAPRVVGTPRFVLGDSVCILLTDPLQGEDAVMVAAPQPPGSSVALWLSQPGVLPRMIAGDTLAAQMGSALAPTATSGLNITIPSEDAGVTTYPNLERLAVVMRPPASAERCAELNAQCGFVADKQGETVNCGACVAGGACMQDNQCCIPRTCEAKGVCGVIPDGCGGQLDCGGCGMRNGSGLPR